MKKLWKESSIASDSPIIRSTSRPPSLIASPLSSPPCTSLQYLSIFLLTMHREWTRNDASDNVSVYGLKNREAPSLAPKLLSNVVAPKLMLLKNPLSKQGFSVLASDCPWKSGSIWSTMALYILNLHISLGYGGLSIVAYLLDEPVLNPQTQAVSLLVVQMLELSGTVFLLSKNIKPLHDLVDFFKANKISKERNWLLASALGCG
ncbi:hypothetical protein ACOSQ3_002413 [Xanthoceras sorbifolium]